MQIGANPFSMSNLVSQTAVQPVKESSQVGEQVLKEQQKQQEPVQQKRTDVNGKGGKLDISA